MDRANFSAKDAQHRTTRALPNGIGTAYASSFDLGPLPERGARLENCELLIEAPALVVADLADGDTMKYSVMHGAAVAPTTVLAADVIVQTGAGGVGAAAATCRFRIPSDCERYLRVRIINGGAGDASDKSATIALLF